MAKILVVAFSALCLLAVSFVTARQTGSTCSLTEQELEKDVMECVAHDPALMLQIIEHLKDLKALLNMDFVCGHKKDLIDLTMCMSDKMIACYPQYADLWKKLEPSRETWMSFLNFACEHRNELDGGSCGQIPSQELYECYVGQFASLMQPKTQADQLSLYCSMLRQLEQCLKIHHGSCSQKYVDLVIQLMEMIVPKQGCSVASVDLKEPSLGSILVHGQPLRFKPQGEVEYRVNQG